MALLNPKIRLFGFFYRLFLEERQGNILGCIGKIQGYFWEEKQQLWIEKQNFSVDFVRKCFKFI